MPTDREINFFCYPHVWKNGIDWYLNLFAKAGTEHRAIGERTTQYSQRTVFPEVLPRILKHLGPLRVIYCVRQPTERIESLHRQMLWMEYAIPFELNKAVRYDPKRFIDSSCYFAELNVYREYLDDSLIHLMFFEDFKAEPETEMRKVYSFLGIDPDFRPPNPQKRLNASKGRPVERRSVKQIRRLPGYNAIKHLMPTQLKRHVRNRMLVQLDEQSTEWNPVTLQRVIDAVAPDAAELLRFAGKPADFWDRDNFRLSEMNL